MEYIAQAWNEGYSARFDCQSRHHNPYFDASGNPDDEGKAQNWDEGWYFAECEIRTM